jgi:hypothetical protein
MFANVLNQPPIYWYANVLLPIGLGCLFVLVACWFLKIMAAYELDWASISANSRCLQYQCEGPMERSNAYYFDFDLKESLNYIASSAAPGGMWKSEKAKHAFN